MDVPKETTPIEKPKGGFSALKNNPTRSEDVEKLNREGIGAELRKRGYKGGGKV